MPVLPYCTLGSCAFSVNEDQTAPYEALFEVSPEKRYTDMQELSQPLCFIIQEMARRKGVDYQTTLEIMVIALQAEVQSCIWQILNYNQVFDWIEDTNQKPIQSYMEI